MGFLQELPRVIQISYQKQMTHISWDLNWNLRVREMGQFLTFTIIPIGQWQNLSTRKIKKLVAYKNA